MSNCSTIVEHLAQTNQGWAVTRHGANTACEGGDEVLLALCNGRVGVRGSLELPSAHRTPAVYVAGIYDKPDRPQSQKVYGLNLHNKAITPAYAIAPTWDSMELCVNGVRLDFLNAEVLRCERTLDMQRGLLLGSYELRDAMGCATRVRVLRAVSMADRDLALMRVEIEAVDYSGPARLGFTIRQDTSPVTIHRLRDYISPTAVLNLSDPAKSTDPVWLHSRVTETGVEIAVAASTAGDGRCCVERGTDSVVEVFAVDLEPGRTVVFERIVALSTSEDSPDPRSRAVAHLMDVGREPFATHLDRHIQAVADRWKLSDVAIEGDDELLQGIRWNVFNLIQMGHPTNPDVSISATGLHGQGYFGHVFWDTEIYMMPFYTATAPDVARNLLLYRYRRLGAARENAKAWGFEGARFPWTSTWHGYDVTPPDWHSAKEVHVTGAVALAFQRYVDWTGDIAFYNEYGVEVLVETARFWRSRVKRGDDGLYHLFDIVGPDEYNANADDNYYTCHLSAWNMRQAVEAMGQLQRSDEKQWSAIAARCGWSARLGEKLLDIANNMAFPRVRDGVCEQHAGYFDLPDAPITRRGPYNMPIVDSYGPTRGHSVANRRT